MRRGSLAAILLTLAWASRPSVSDCGETAGSGPRSAAEIDALRYDEVCFKAAHNSIDRLEPIPRQLDWDPGVPHDGGCRGIELDIVQDPSRTKPGDEWVFAVQHGGPFNASSPRLEDCLRLVRAWAEARTSHDPIAIHIDLKPGATLGDDAAFAVKIDAILERELGRKRIFAPSDLQGDHATLLRAVEARGWPSVGSLRGKLLVVFSGGDLDPPVGRRRKAYLETDPRKRLAFVDLDQRAAGASGRDECDIGNPYYNEGSRVFLNIELGRKDWTRLAREASERRFIVRVWKANDEASWKRARESRVHVLSTDRVTGSPWATVGPGTLAGMERRTRL